MVRTVGEGLGDSMNGFVPHDFVPPPTPEHDEFALEPLGVEHNEADHRAWMSSIEHIKATPGFEGRPWPVEMSLEANAEDLRAHQEDFVARRGFTYTVLDQHDAVVGCVYIYPNDDGSPGAHVRSWVRADRADLDLPLRRTVAAWLESEWPFTMVRYDGVRPG